ncbi:MAG: FliH/SctL family protein, partial [Planctomycetaceae bacterium]
IVETYREVRPAAPVEPPPVEQSVPPVQAGQTIDPVDQSVEEMKSLSGVLADVCGVVVECEQRRAQSMKELQQLAVEIGFAAAERLVRSSLDRGNFCVERLVEEVLKQAVPETVIAVRLNPIDLKLLEEVQTLHPPPVDGPRFVGDPDVTRGSCRVECEGFDLVSILEDEIDEIKLYVLQELENAQSERRQNERPDRGVRPYPDGR